MVKPKTNKKNRKGNLYIGKKEYGKAKILKQIALKSRAKVTLRLTQGKKREIRRVFHRMNTKIISLKRIRFCKLSLGNLELGKFIFLNNKQKKLLE